MVKLFEEDKREQGRQSSKGNQLKFEREGIWYKADYLGYEGLAEYVVSKLLAHSSLKEDEYVEVTPKSMRMRKVILDHLERKRANKE